MLELLVIFFVGSFCFMIDLRSVDRALYIIYMIRILLSPAKA
jgi:hypothetical protein